ncbi:MAG: TMEM175 family protein [Mycobacterium sp.]
MAAERGVFQRDTVEFGRALNLIDAIFGFSLTLLVTTLDVPPAESWKSISAVLSTGLGDQLLAFVISFVVVVGFWVSNHQMLSSFRALDSERLPLPTAVYAANVAAIVLLSVVLVLVGRRRGLADPSRPVNGLMIHSLAVAAVFLISIPVAYRFGPDNAKWCWLSLVVISPALDLIVKRVWH